MKNYPSNHTWWKQRTITWSSIGLAWLVLFALGIGGFIRHASLHNLNLSIWDAAYLTLQLIPMNSGAVEPPLPWELQAARFLIPLLVAFSAVKAFAMLFREQAQLFSLRFARDHVIVCGLSRKGYHLAISFRKQGKKVVVIEENEENEWIEQCRLQGAIVLLGNATDPEILWPAGIERAQCIFAVCDDDGVNAEIIVQAQQLVGHRSGPPLVCLAHLLEPQLCTLLQEQRLSLGSRLFQMELFNIFERGARILLQEHPVIHPGLSTEEAPPQVFIIGLGRMGESVVIEVARQWWAYWYDKKFRLPTALLPTPITVTILDIEANRKIKSLRARFPHLNQLCRMQAIQMDVHSPEFQCGDIFSESDDVPATNYSHAFICLDNDSLGLQAGLSLHGRLPGAQIIVRMSEAGGMAHLLESSSNHFVNLSAYGLLDRTCTPNLLLSTPREALARAMHEDFVAHARAAGQYDPKRAAMQNWEQLTEHYRQANYHRVDRLNAELDALNCRIMPLKDWYAPVLEFSAEEIEKMASLEHDYWCIDKRSQGWRFGPERSDALKTNPDLVTWTELPVGEQEKNRELVRPVPFLLVRCGFQVIRGQ
jgi:hypothetical protein